MSQGTLVNCRKCGTLFVKSTRDICDNCFKAEVEMSDKIKNFIQDSEKEKVTVEEILLATKISKAEFDNLFEKGRLFSVMSQITVKCRFCGIEFECEQKASFICPKCLLKFSKKEPLNRINQSNEDNKEPEKKATKRTIINGQARYDFIQNYEL